MFIYLSFFLVTSKFHKGKAVKDQGMVEITLSGCICGFGAPKLAFIS